MTIHKTGLQTQVLDTYLRLLGIPDAGEDTPEENFIFLSAQCALASSRQADAIERFVLESSSWFSIANKLSAIQVKLDLLEKEVSTASQAFLDSAGALHAKISNLEFDLADRDGEIKELEHRADARLADVTAHELDITDLRADIGALMRSVFPEKEADDFDPFLTDVTID